jgi:hypothetical protein
MLKRLEVKKKRFRKEEEGVYSGGITTPSSIVLLKNETRLEEPGEDDY